MNCPAREKLELHFESALSPEESAGIAAHAESCESCGGHLRRLQEEARALKRSLPDVAAPPGLARLVPAVPAPNPWKPVSLFALAAVLLLSVGMVAIARRNADAWDAVRANVQAQVRFHIDRNEPEKAIGALSAFPADPVSRRLADTARVEIAAKCDDATASKLLDEIDLADKDLDEAERVAAARVAVYERLFEQKVLRNGAVPTPFDLRPYRRDREEGLPWQEMARISGRLIAVEIERRDVASRRGTAAPSSEMTALARIARYALGEAPYESVKPATDAERLAFGDVLYRERQFDRAIEVWKPVISDEKVYRKLAELAALKRLAPKSLNVWDFEVDTLLGAHPEIDREASAKIEGLFRRAKEGILPLAPIEPAAAVSEDPLIEPPRRIDQVADDPDQLYLLVDHQQFRLEVGSDRPFTAKGGARLTLKSAYRGPVRARLYRAPDAAFFSTLTESNLVERRRQLALAHEWETTFEPMSKNGEMGTFTLTTPKASAGLFVLIADARYCPVYAVAKFIVTDTALVQQVAADRVLVFAADRITGAPLGAVDLSGEVTGEYVLRPEDSIPSDDSNADEFRRGFEAAWGGKAPEADAGPSWMRGHQRAKDLRASKPDAKHAFAGKTGADGLFEWTPPSAWRDDYRYRVLTTTTAAGTYSRVESQYAVDVKLRSPRALVYSDRPVYRPGDRVRFKAMLRVLDNEGLHPWSGREALFEFGTASRTLFARSWTVSDFGTVEGDFDLPYDALTGWHWVRVANGPASSIFKVEEYRKPDFTVTINHPAAVRAGQSVAVDIAVRTWSGDPVPNARVDVWISATALSRSIHETQPAWQDVENRTIMTDASGLCTTRFTTDAGVGARYVINARAVDTASRREVASSSALEAAGPVATGIVIETDRPSYYPGETATIRVRADAAAVRLEERTQNEKRFTTTLALDRRLGSLEYVVPEKDQALHVGVRVGDEWAWTPVPLAILPRSADGAIAVRPDKSVYRIGETARIAIRASDKGQHVLVEIGTGRIHRREVVEVNGDAVISVPITPDLVPNVAVVALAVRADAIVKATGEIRVPPGDRFLTVEVETDKPEYGPGEECRATVRVVDWRGNPVNDCEISLGVVDESIYAIEEDRTPDLRDYFHKYERKLAYGESFFFREPPGSFIVWKTPTFVFGLRGVYDAIGAGGGGGGRYGSRLGGRNSLVARGGGGRASEAWVRSHFQDTAHWEAALRTNAEGVATATFRFPDNLSSFRFTARGITRDTKVGAVRHRAVVRKPFYTRIAAPRMVQEGNAVAIACMVHNMTPDPQRVRVEFKGSYPVIASDAEESMAVAAGGVAKIEYLINVDRWLHDASFTFHAWSDAGHKDAVEITVPGRRHGAPFDEGRSGTVAAGTPTEEVFRVPDGVIPGTLALKLNLDAGVHAAVIEGLEPLIEYPYGCIEQTMSRFFPAAVASKAVGTAPNRWSEKLPSVVAAGLRRVYSFQNGDGSWGWFPRDGANEAMTAYVLYGLSICRKSGVGVDRAAADQAAAYLRARLETLTVRSPLNRGPLPADVDKRVYIVLALSEYETAWGGPTMTTKRLASRLASRDDERSEADDVMLAIACRRLGLVDADRLAERVEGRRLSDIATAALTLQLQVERGGDVGDALRFLLSRRSGKGWRTTIESAYAILGLSSLLERGKPGDYQTPGRMTVEVNGSAVKSLELPSALDGAFDGRISVPEPEGGWRGKVIVRLSFAGRGTAFYTASLTGLLGGEDRPAISRGLEIVREYYEESGEGWRLVTDGQLRAGRPVLVRLRITSPDDREYVMVTDPRGDGFEPRQGMPRLQERRRAVEGLSDRIDLSDGWAHRVDEFRRDIRGDAARESAWAKALLREIIEKRRFRAAGDEAETALPPPVAATLEHRDDRSIFFVERMGRGESNLYYVVLPELAGAIHVLAPTASPMYAPELFAAGTETKLSVVDGRVVTGSLRGHAAPPGVDGLLPVIDAIGTVDADVLIALGADNRRIGSLLMHVVDERALRVWLTIGSGTRSDLATRMLAADALDLAEPEWRSVVEEAMRAPAQIGRVALDDGALQWVREDRAFRLALLEGSQRLKGSARLEGELPAGVTMSKILAAGPAPAGDALVTWKLSQRVDGAVLPLSELVAMLERDLEMPVKVLSAPTATTTPPAGRTVAELLDEALAGSKHYWKVRSGGVVIGTLEELTK